MINTITNIFTDEITIEDKLKLILIDLNKIIESLRISRV